MLAAIDANAGGKLSKVPRRPSDDDLALALTNRPMIIKCMVWEMGDNSGNWIAAVSPKSKGVSVADAKPMAKKPAPVPDVDDDDVPF